MFSDGDAIHRPNALASDTSVQRRTRKGAQRRMRPSVCNGLGGGSRATGFKPGIVRRHEHNLLTLVRAATVGYDDDVCVFRTIAITDSRAS